MLLHRPARGGLIAKDKLSRWFEDFVHGKWLHLIDDGRTCAKQSSKIATRKRGRGQHDDVERRVARAQALVQNCQQEGRHWKARRWLQATNTRGTNFNADLQSPDTRCQKISRGSGQVVDLSRMRNSSPKICDHSDAVQWRVRQARRQNICGFC